MLVVRPIAFWLACAGSTVLAQAPRPSTWQPFQPVTRPEVPAPKDGAWVRNPIDAFVSSARDERGLAHRPEASRTVLLRRLHLDLTGLSPTPAELREFLADDRSDAYERVVERLLESPHYGERWGRHWMDVWRYSDWAGWGDQVRDSQPHIWRWRDWIVESLNADKGYDRMLVEMLAGDEIAPGDNDTLRATGYLARNFKLLSREAWMQETVDHCAQAFLGVTLGCARCHDHKYDPVSQLEYYKFRAVFEPYSVRLDRLPGQPDTAKAGLARVFDANLDVKTYLFERGDDRQPDKEHPLDAGAPGFLGGGSLKCSPVSLPLLAYSPEKQEFVVRETVAASEAAIAEARAGFQRALIESSAPEKSSSASAQNDADLAELAIAQAEARHAALIATLKVESLEDSGAKDRDANAWRAAATQAQSAQRWARLLDARRAERVARSALEKTRAAKKPEAETAKAAEALTRAEKELASSREAATAPASVEYAKREIKTFPSTSTGRRLALARWLTDKKNPLAARVAVNHMWLRHFGQAIVPTVNDFGKNARPPSHPELLDWLASELMEPANPAATPWSMKHLHRLMVTSSAYRMASTPDEACLTRDPDNVYLWRMSSRRLEAECVRDNVLHVSGRLDCAMGGPDLDHRTILSTPRRSLYYRTAAEKQAEFLKVFDVAGVTECYERKSSVVPQQALALSNSEIVIDSARRLAAALQGRGDGSAPSDRDFVQAAFETVLARLPTESELSAAMGFLADEGRVFAAAQSPGLKVRETLVHALLNHNDFVTVR